MNQGIIKKWMDDKNFGFIKVSEWDSEFFFHITWCMPGYQPREGDNVTFVIGKNDRTGKTQAQDVQPA